jgi:periplasmic divalent cation tolerance protein
MYFVYIVFPRIGAAKKVGEMLVKMRLAACVNVLPMESIYHWQDKLTRDKEVVLVAKTMKKNLKRLEEFVKSTHSYEVPFIGWWKLDVNKDYKKWLENELK